MLTDAEKQVWYDFFNKHIDLHAAIKKVMLTDSCGITFDNYQDYERYGDWFQRISIPPKARS